MRFGLHYLFRRRSGDSLSLKDLYEAELEQAQFAEHLGFDDVWVGERHFAEGGWMPSPLVAAAAIAARTTRIRIATSAVLPALHHPLRLAEDCAVVDNLSAGRFTLGVALGSQAGDYEVFGIPFKQRAGRLEETVELLRRCWVEDSFTHRGRYFEFPEVRCQPKPTQVTIPIWIAAAKAAPALRRAALLGDGWLAEEPPRGQRRETYLRALAEAGRSTPVPAIAAPTRRFLFATEDPERDAAWLRPLAHEMLAPAGASAPAAPKLPGGVTADQLIDQMLLVATPERIVEELTVAYEQGSFTHHIHTPILAGAPIERCNEALELFARAVLPSVRELGGDAESFAYPSRHNAQKGAPNREHA